MSAWLRIRQAEEALRGGRLQEAVQLLGSDEVRGHKKAEALRSLLSKAYLERAGQHCRHGDWRAAWEDLTAAENCGCHSEPALRLRAEVQRRGLEEARRLLEGRDPEQALNVLGQLKSKGLTGHEVSLFEQLANDWLIAERLAAKGDFGPALDKVQRYGVERVGALRDVCRDWKRRQGEYEETIKKLYNALEARRWHEVIRLADEVLSLAPDHTEAVKLRTKAWHALEPPTLVPPRPSQPVEEPSRPREPDRRLLLWIDGVGGYLVCLADRVSLGQTGADIPLAADVSRLHAYLARDEESYLVQALRPTRLNGNEVSKEELLSDGDVITLGSRCQLRFRMPVKGSLTARLEFVSNHRLPLSLDGVILMAESCLLGPEGEAHIKVPDLDASVALFCSPSGWQVRVPGEFSVNDVGQNNLATVPLPGTVSGATFRFTLEPVEGGGFRL